MPNRVDEWPQRLREVVDRHRAGAVQPGKCDCASLVAEAVDALQGQRRLRRFLTFTTKRGALKVLQRRGFESGLFVIDSHLPRKPVAELQRGDLAWGAVLGDGPLSMPAVVTGAHCVTMSAAGLVSFPLSEMSTGWAV